MRAQALLTRTRTPLAAALLSPARPQDVFLSYAWGANSARKPLADELYLALRAAGLRVWKDDLEMSHDLRASMSEGIAKSEVVVMLVSPAYAASGPCMFEARATAAAGKPLVTCCVEPGFWRSWFAADGSGARALPEAHELVALARLKTHLFVDLSAASAVDWSSESLDAGERQTLLVPEAMPRLLSLIEAARKGSGGEAGLLLHASAPAAEVSSERRERATFRPLSLEATAKNTLDAAPALTLQMRVQRHLQRLASGSAGAGSNAAAL